MELYNNKSRFMLKVRDEGKWGKSRFVWKVKNSCKTIQYGLCFTLKWTSFRTENSERSGMDLV